MKKSNDLISIIVPCYNVCKIVDKCFNSLVNQTYKNIEIIFIDDGSKDNTKDVLKKLIKSDKRCKYIYKTNGGLSSARNCGMKYIKGKYVCFIDSDDYVSFDYIEKLYESIIINNSNISICDIERIYPNHTSINKMDNLTIEMCKFPAAWNKMYLASLFKDYSIQFPEGLWYEDLGTIPKLTMLENYSIVNLPLYKYVQNSSSIMHTYDDRIYQIYKVIEDVENFCKENNIYDSKYSNLEFINVYHVLLGTIYRASFHEKFSTNMIKDIYLNVTTKYPNWYKNKYIKNLPFIYKIFFKILKFKMFRIIYIALKLFGKYLYI